ncbi:hypothetical protein BWI97_14355 [Siphonobacter sp. BAB-5405]|nr:hypothetical protein BWI97_14355 [Siphonobacter sp. BAB-5405]
MLPEYEIGNGIRMKTYLHFGFWVVGTRGELAHFRVKHIIEGKVEKEVFVPHFVVTHDQINAKCWITHVSRHFRVIDWNQFMPAYMCALELRGYELGDEMRFVEL